jgi:flagellar FliJ protein
MKKFRFPLRSVTTIRNLRELRAREQFSAAVQTYIAADEQLQSIRAKLTELEDILRSGRAQRFRPTDEVSFIQALKDETIKATRADAAVTTARNAMEVARQAWLESRRDLRVLENLERKARTLHRQETERENQAAMDDRTSALVARQTAQNHE